MSRSASKPILPWPVLAVGVVVAAIALIAVFAVGNRSGGGPDQGSPTPAPTPTLGEIPGTIGYITAEGDFALMDAHGGSRRSVTTSGSVTAFEWAPDGSVAAVVEGSGAASAVRGVRQDGSETFSIARSSNPLWSPEGDALAVMQGTTLAVYDVAGNQLRTFENAALPAWSPDGKFLAFLKVGEDGLAVPVIGSLEDGIEKPLAADIQSAEPLFPIAWHPGGDVIGYRNHLYELSTGTTTELPGTAIYWSPAGHMLLAAGEFVPADNATPGLLLDASQGFKPAIGLFIRTSAQDIPPQLFIQKWTDWTPDGRYFLYLDPDPGLETARVYDTVPPYGQDWDRNISGERPDISPDGLTSAFMYEGKVWVMPLDKSALVAVAEGSFPAWQPEP
jgi:dipeptidyl aminopeptidase/acylaminoacyl peptidase